jgi:hypothetical protein
MISSKELTQTKGPYTQRCAPGMAANSNPWFFYHMGRPARVQHRAPFARKLFLKVTLDRTGTAQLEAEIDLRASLSIRLMKEVAQQLETLCMVREAAWDDSQHPRGIVDDFATPPSRKKPRTNTQPPRIIGVCSL